MRTRHPHVHKLQQKLQQWVSISVVLALFVTGCTMIQPPAEAPAASPVTSAERPNIVIFLADDMGNSDIGPFGSEIPTPNIDSLAQNGLIFTNFHTMASCSPTRSNLLTGVDNHRNGFGTMGSQLQPTQAGQPGYEVVLNDRVVTVATLLRDAGYHTFMAGKWHLGNEGGGEGNFWPTDRGFERSFALLPGAASHFSDRIGFSAAGPIAAYLEDGVELPLDDPAVLPKDFYSTRFYTDKIISYVDEIQDDRPFFAYFAYTAPHGPLHAPVDDTYVDEILNDTTTYNYQAGWDVVRQRRFERQQELGLIPAGLEFPPRWEGDPLGNPILAWDELTPEAQAYEAKRMAIYAAMIRHMDDEIGRFIQHLKDTGEYENTLFVFFGDNGADDVDRTYLPAYAKWFAKIGIDNSYENMGRPNSFILMSPGWAQVSSTPYFGAKATVAEGGIHNAMIMAYPGRIDPGTRSHALTTLLDLTPTFLDYAGILAQHPGVANPTAPGEVFALDGRSLRPLVEGVVDQVYGAEDYLGFELFGTVNKALISGDGWKILRLGEEPWGEGIDEDWKLFNLNEDPTELHDLAAEHPDRWNAMKARYRAWEEAVGFVSAYLRDDALPGDQATYSIEVTNANTVEDTVALTCTSPWPCTLATAAGDAGAAALSVTVAPGATIPVTINLAVPDDLPVDGKRYLSTVTRASQSDPAQTLDFTIITFLGEIPTE